MPVKLILAAGASFFFFLFFFSFGGRGFILCHAFIFSDLAFRMPLVISVVWRIITLMFFFFFSIYPNVDMSYHALRYGRSHLILGQVVNFESSIWILFSTTQSHQSLRTFFISYHLCRRLNSLGTRYSVLEALITNLKLYPDDPHNLKMHVSFA